MESNPSFVQEESLDLPVMVAFPVPAAIGSILLSIVRPALPDDAKILPLDQLHLTLALLGESDEVAITQSELIRMIGLFCVDHMSVEGNISGVGIFNLDRDDEDDIYGACLYASFDSPELVDFRQDLVSCLEKCGVEVEKEHGFTPHITLAYLPNQGDLSRFEIPRMDVTFDKMVVAWGDSWTVKDIGAWSMRVKAVDGDAMTMGMAMKIP
jgi:2'-5' RNA ligase